jgi:hypothetical protein
LRILLLPLDDRPCNRQFPLELGRMAGARVVVPPKRLLGWFTRAGRCEELGEWLLLRAGDAQAAIVSADMLCCGGLVASRLPHAAQATALARLGRLREVKRRSPGAKLYVFSTIMRLAPTLAREEDRQAHDDLAAFGRLGGKERLSGEEARALGEACARPGGEKVEGYLAARARNLAVNRALIGLAAEGVVDYLVIGQDDAAETGLHVAERQELVRIARDGNLGSARIEFLAGADEIGMSLVSRAVMEARGLRPRAALFYSSPERRRRALDCEDRPLEENAAAHLRCAGVRLARRGETEFVLLVHNAGSAERAVSRIARLVESKARVALADVASPNGSDAELVERLLAAGLAGRLASYAAWGTAGNTLGTVIAQSCLALAGGEREERARLEFLLCRFLDDYLYQRRVRPRLARDMAKLGCSSLDLGRGWRSAEEGARRLLSRRIPAVAQAILQGASGREGLAWRLAGWGAGLPWRRIFEIELGVSISSSGVRSCRGRRSDRRGSGGRSRGQSS